MNTDNYQLAVHLIRLLKRHSFETRLVGGCVRDRLLGKDPKDYDLATTALPEKVLGILTDDGIKTIATGLQHGTVTAVLEGQAFEITTLRCDTHTDGRHAQVRYVDSFFEDAKRRDFTINAMYEDENGRVFDFFEGVSDLSQKKIKFVGSPRERIKEDYLRILRYFRFSAQLGFYMDDETLKVIEEERDGLKKLSKERIVSEISKIFTSSQSAFVLRHMNEKGLLETIFGKSKTSLVEMDFDFFDRLNFDSKNVGFYRWSYFAFYFDLTKWTLSKKDQMKIALLHQLKGCAEELQQLFEEPIQRSKVFDFVANQEGKHLSYFLSETVIDFYIAYFSYFKEKPKAALFQTFKIYLEKNAHLREPKDFLDGHEILAMSHDPDKKKITHWKKKLLHAYWDDKWQTKEEARSYLQSILDADAKP